ncbi:MAG TPA: hypothetical protein VFQ12_09445 [Thermoleophilaceae bacterium]|nr:hypothetical protein [Thermoleophilaceae bacterium]
MTGRVTLPPAQLLVYRFGPDASFEGRLVGALERIESGGALRVLDVLFVQREAETGELVAVGLHGDAGGIVGPLLDFRLDPAKRRRATERTLDDASDVPAAVVRGLGKRLEPGAAMVAVLVDHAWARALEDAVSRTGGTPVASDFVDATALGELAADLLAAAGRGGTAV